MADESYLRGGHESKLIDLGDGTFAQAVGFATNSVITVTVGEVIATVTTVAAIATVSELSNVSSVDVVDTVSKVISVVTVTELSNVSSVDVVDTVSKVVSVVTVSEVSKILTVDTITKIVNVVTVSEVSNIVAGNITVVNSLNTVSHTTPSIGVASTLALTTNTARKYALIMNDTTNTNVYLSLTVAAITNSGIYLGAGGKFEMSRMFGNLYSGAVNAISDTTTTVLVTEGS